jgi:hypothetical protein
MPGPQWCGRPSRPRPTQKPLDEDLDGMQLPDAPDAVNGVALE